MLVEPPPDPRHHGALATPVFAAVDLEPAPEGAPSAEPAAAAAAEDAHDAPPTEEVATSDATTDDDAPTGDADANDATPATTAAPRNEGLPPLGTVIIKRDRHGAERVRCTVVEGGVEYAGKVHKSLSAAAIAASRDLGNMTKQLNGWTWWGITKAERKAPTAKALDFEMMARAWDRYSERVEAAAKGATGEDKSKLHTELLARSTALFDLAATVA